MPKGVKIDPKARIVTSVEYNNFDELKALMEDRFITLVPICAGSDKWNGLIVYADDEGLLKPERHFTGVPFYPEPLAGPLLILGPSDDEGNETDCPLTALDVAKDIMWLGRG